MKNLKIPKIIGHRGCMGYAPENTLEAIHTAADMNVKWVELDVKLTRDQVPVIFHDETLERVSNGHGAIADIDYDDLRQLEVGSFFSEGSAGLYVPTLEEAVDVLLERDLGFNLELKPCPGREKETAEASLDVLSHIWDDHERLLISSSSETALDAAMDMVEDWHRAFIIGEDWPKNIQELCDVLALSAFVIEGHHATQEQVEALRDLAKPMIAYTVNDPSRAWLLQSWGVCSLITDVPDVVEDGILTVH